MIELEDLNMRYAVDGQAVDVLRGIDLAVAAGESVAVIGPSGSGKTTLLLLLAGLEQPRGGSIRLDGVSMAGLDADALADLRRDRVGIIFQAFHLVPSLTALCNVALPLEIAGSPDARERARQMLDRVGLADRARHYPAQLSGGEQQRVAIARALVHAPALVLADEPTGNLDKRTGEKISDILFELHDESNSTLVVATHDARMAARCDRVLQLDEGRLIQQRGDELLN
ncbi:MAG: ABC transporter ATP-binding protein [Gammaproteobacteria bacterium]|nr:ABC transporter ATP-binding protein [Gammaproteobacteria bacterium]